jgi:CRAL/TRIO domain
MFGLDRAFSPLTLNNMTKEDIVAGEAGFASFVLRDKHDSDDRIIFFSNQEKHTRNGYDSINMIRIAWYMIHAILTESEMTQKKGLIFLAFPKKAKISQMDSKLDQMMIESVKRCLPIRISGMHITHPPSFFSGIWPIVSLFLSKRTKQRVKVHVGSREKVLRTLTSKYGINSKYCISLPTLEETTLSITRNTSNIEEK